MGESTAIQVLIADDHPIFRMGLRRLPRDRSGHHHRRRSGEQPAGHRAGAVASAGCSAARRRDGRHLQPRRASRAQRRRPATERRSAAEIVLLTASLNSTDTMLALRLGAVGVMLKTTASELLFKCLRSVMAGQYWLGRDSLNLLIDAFLQAQGARTDADRRPYRPHRTRARSGGTDCDRGVQQGHRHRAATERRDHQASSPKIFDKTGQSSRVELALFASQLGLSR